MNVLTGEITEIERLNNSVNGNPRYAFSVSANNEYHRLILSSDSACAYEVGNPGYRVGDVVRFELTRAGRIAYMRATSDTRRI